ncbi:MAG TPA: hypothetical protein PKI82_08355 [Ruminococcus flavefaciens]|nr:hypothetical protein [Ruminococcus flavefaciens]
MENAKCKRGRPPKRKAMEFEGMTYEGAINNALDKEVAAELDDTLANKSEDELTDDERKHLKRKREKKSYTLNVRFTESEMQDILARCEQYGYKNKTEYIRDCVRARVDLTPDRNAYAEVNKVMKRIGSNVNQILLLMRRTGHIYDQDIQQIKEGVNEIWHTLLSIRSGQQSAQRSLTSQEIPAMGAQASTQAEIKPDTNDAVFLFLIIIILHKISCNVSGIVFSDSEVYIKGQHGAAFFIRFLPLYHMIMNNS